MMTIDRPLDCPDPAISVAMLKLIEAIETHRPDEDPVTLAFRSAQLVGTVRRCLATGPRRDLHHDLWLATELEDFERRWNSSAVIGGRFDLFARDSRRFLAMIDERMGAGSLNRRPSVA
ncbi:hypothetical protein [Sphingomonas mesophila]|uniref:hypothetical protein n=1 Tax=Sphingomonas mesophila TaxID=2303576 RepID=UPI000E595EE7|nr:hypothetical protein [Sphingomonas mesophila]